MTANTQTAGRNAPTQLVEDAWKIIEALADRQFDLAGVAELAEVTGQTPSKTRRLLITWEGLGLVERRGDLWRLSHYLTHDLPGRLMMGLTDRFNGLAGVAAQATRPAVIGPDKRDTEGAGKS